MSAANSENNQSHEPVRAYVVLKGNAGNLSTAQGPISSDNVQAYTASPSVRDQVRTQLEDLGLSVRHVSPLSITVEATPEQFESVFHGRLKKMEQPNKPFSVWTWARSPKIPAELSDKVDTVVLPQPAKIISSG